MIYQFYYWNLLNRGNYIILYNSPLPCLLRMWNGSPPWTGSYLKNWLVVWVICGDQQESCWTMLDIRPPGETRRLQHSNQVVGIGCFSWTVPSQNGKMIPVNLIMDHLSFQTLYETWVSSRKFSEWRKKKTWFQLFFFSWAVFKAPVDWWLYGIIWLVVSNMFYFPFHTWDNPW